MNIQHIGVIGAGPVDDGKRGHIGAKTGEVIDPHPHPFADAGRALLTGGGRHEESGDRADWACGDRCTA